MKCTERDRLHELALTLVAVLLIFWGGRALLHLLPRMLGTTSSPLTWYQQGKYALNAAGVIVGVTLFCHARRAQATAAVVLVIMLAVSAW